MGAAVLFAVGATIQQRVASRTDVGGRRVDPLLLVKLFAQPVWLVGFFLTLANFSMAATALAKGRLVVVEPILACGLLLALPLSAAVGKGRMARRDWIAAGAAAAGLSLFLVLAAPTKGADTVGSGPLAAVVLSIEAAVLVLAVLTSRFVRRFLSVALGAAAGVMAATTDACTKTVAQLAGTHHLGVFGDPRLWLLTVAGLTTFTIQQNAYRAAGLAASLPAIAVLHPTTGALLGIALYDEVIHTGALHLFGELIAAALAVWGIVTLARSPLIELVHPLAGSEQAAQATPSPR